MHFHVAGPKHGWNTVFWDLAIVTVGVLVALAAQQVADDLHWKREAADFRNALKPELSIDLVPTVFAPRKAPASTSGSTTSKSGSTAGAPIAHST